MPRYAPVMIWERMTEPSWAFVVERARQFLWWRWETYDWHVRFYQSGSSTPTSKVDGRAASLNEAISRAKVWAGQHSSDSLWSALSEEH